ncbi:3394_t:CDS:2 [Ambispora leptoticha]|uniref:3394_t:CDS:1 n=1 Tax=Ambispora leptoticha TaxID=144679 RepID=A0A9N9AKI9_9GLOM|nr:3394_t:CDS:2 [Ambispora leptoticha]
MCVVDKENLQIKVEKIVSCIVWLLEETQELADATRNGEQSKVISHWVISQGKIKK